MPYPGGGGGGGGGQLNPSPTQVNDIHDYSYTFEKLRAEVYILYDTCTSYIMLNQHILRIN